MISKLEDILNQDSDRTEGKIKIKFSELVGVIAKKTEAEKPQVVLKIGDRVRMIDGKSIGTIDKIEKNKAVVNYGVFTSKVNIEQLEYVQTKK